MNMRDNRIIGRELAFKFLFKIEVSSPAYLVEKNKKSELLAQDLINFYVSISEPDPEHPGNKVNSTTKLIAERIILGVIEHRAEIEENIQQSMTKWNIEKINKTELAILKVACFELKYLPENPVNVVINEAINMAKKFGDQKSSAFINGVLDHLAKNNV